jgi:Zn-dependent metalloprotease
MSHLHTVTCIIPPHVLERIARNGDQRQREMALRTLATDTTLRALRVHNVAAGASAGARRLRLRSGEAAGQAQRTVFDAAHSQDLPSATIARKEGDGPTSDEAVNEAYDGLGATYDLYWNAYERDSIDDEGLPLNGYVHYGDDYDNAFWDGQEMVFGDGDGQLFKRFTICIDVIGHELTHGVTEDEAGLQYFRQSGALNESISDVFGSLVKQRELNQKADEADWLIGHGLLADGVKGTALRSMKEPGTAYDDPVLGKDPQPGHMRDYVHTMSDNGGVHINSGIPNRAFYLAAVAIGGYAWDPAGRIWYEALRDPRLKPTAQFRAFARATLRAAARLYSQTSNEYQAVRQAWSDVGVEV